MRTAGEMARPTAKETSSRRIFPRFFDKRGFAAALTVWAALAATTPWFVGASQFSLSFEAVLASVTVFLALLTVFLMRAPPSVSQLAELSESFLRPFLGWPGLILVALTAWIVGGAWLEGFPISGDVVAMILQAETYVSGRLWAPAPPVPEVFGHSRFVAVGDKWVSQYPPGWAVLVAPFAFFGAPIWLAPGVFAAAVVALFWHLARRRLDRAHAALGVLVLCLTPFFVLNASTPYSHVATAFFGLAAIAAVMKRLDGKAWTWCLLAGAMLGAMGLLRPFNAIIFILVIGGALVLAGGLRSAISRRTAVSLAALCAGGLPFAAALLAYHHAITSSMFMTIPAWMGNTEPLGLVSAASLKESLRRVTGLVLTASPVLVVASALAPLALALARRLTPVDLVFPATIAAFAFYGGTGGPEQSYGPRYLFEAYPFLVLSAVVAAAHAAPRFPAVGAAVALHLVTAPFGLAGWLLFERVAIHHLSEPYRLAEAAQLKNAVVLLQKAPGHRIPGYRRGYYTDFPRNGLDVTAPSVVYALDVDGSRKRLRALFSTRAFYVYDGATLSPLGTPVSALDTRTLFLRPTRIAMSERP